MIILQKMSLPTLSICIPTYNGQAFLAESLESALQQNGQDIEILIIDDGSTDQTPEIIHSFAQQDSRVRFFLEKNAGIVANWNRCILRAQGEWIKFLFQDDLLLPHFIGVIRPLLDSSHPLIFHQRDFIFELSCSPEQRTTYENLPSIFSLDRNPFAMSPRDIAFFLTKIFLTNPIGEPSNSLIHRSIFASCGLFNPHYQQCIDLEFWTRCGLQHGFFLIPETLSLFRVHPQSTTQKNHAHRWATNSLDALQYIAQCQHHPEFELMREAARVIQYDLNLGVSSLWKSICEQLEQILKNAPKQTFSQAQQLLIRWLQRNPLFKHTWHSTLIDFPSLQKTFLASNDF